MNYRKEGFVSLWLGTVKSEKDLEKLMIIGYTDDGDLIPSGFSKLFSMGRYNDDFREVRFYDKGIKSIPEALNGFSYSDDITMYFESLIPAEKLHGFNSVVLIYNFQYSGDKTEVENSTFGHFKYIGFTRYCFTREALVAEISKNLGGIPWDYEKKIFSLDLDKRKQLFSKISEIKSIQGLDNLL